MKTIIEAGHFYLFDDDKGEPVGFLEEQKQGILIALQIARELAVIPEFLLFIDDYHGNPHLENDWSDEAIEKSLQSESEVLKATAFMSDNKVEPQLISELALTSAAAHLYQLLVKKGVVAKGGRNLFDEFDHVGLLTKDDQPTCSLIDSALYLKKIGLESQNPTITVLPVRYHSQQDQVRQILKSFGLQYPPITVVYHDQVGEIIEVDDWSKGKTYAQ